MKVARTFFKAITIASTTLLLGLAGCAFDEPIDYTTGGSSSPSGGGTGGTPSGGDSGGNTSLGGSSVSNNCDGSSTYNFLEWSCQFGTSSTEKARGMATDSSGNVYVTGYTKGNLDNKTNAGDLDLFVVKYDSAGVKQWTEQLGSS